MKRSLFLLLSAVLVRLSCTAQPSHQLCYLKGYTPESNLDSLSESLMRPLLVYRGVVYVLAPECWTRISGGGANERFDGSGANQRLDGADRNDRSASGNNNERQVAGDDNDRFASGGNNGRNEDGANNDRSGTGSGNDRNQGGEGNDRQAAGGAIQLTCSRDADGLLTLQFRNCRPDKRTRIFYNHRYHTQSSKTLQIRFL